ncbi:MAG: hypothetical protein WBP22_00250 [Candidatus Saccharimonas sp.]
MNDELLYIATPRSTCRPVRIDTILAKRMREFLLERRRKVWQAEGR